MSRSTVRSRHPLAVRRRALMLAAGAAVLTLSAGCGTSRIAQTACPALQGDCNSLASAYAPGVDASVGNMQLRNVMITPPDGGQYLPGDSAGLTLVMVNESDKQDRLVGVRSDIASNVTLQRSTSAAAASPSPTTTSVTTVTPTPSPELGSATPVPSTSPSKSPSSTSSPSAPSSASGRINVAISAESYVALDDRRLVLHDLSQGLHNGQLVSVTFTFANAGSTTVKVPVGIPNTPAPAQSFEPSKGLDEPPTG